MGSRRFPKLSTKDIFDKWSRNLKTELNTIPLCSGRFEKESLQNPRLEPNASYDIFMDVNGKFDSLLFQSSIMLFNMLDMLKDKITKFLYSTLTYCVQDNDAA